MKKVICAGLIVFAFAAEAKEPVSIGDGKYMLRGRAMTLFTTSAKIVENLMEDAEEFCQSEFGKEAVLTSSRGEEAKMGFGGNPTGSIEFRCGPSVTSQSTVSDSLDELLKLKTLLDSGAITQEEYDELKREILEQ
ncbi:SHOCT domain-containing protein [Luteimonas sp. MC1828]|uniref:SHOCT domain-containing protein n=1 Tax=Luteimonas sp. MC1828 TaxID=2799787 RepID=UPI0018F16243|nr:SHOCT domain-containing protein [Luteimonas sp. MC1828]